jgi:hypothetical protein
LDDVQFIRHGWIERNRILKPETGWQYISCPLQKHYRDTRIADILIKNEEPWDKKIIAQLDHYKKKAPYFKETIGLLEEIFSKKTDSVSRFNEISLNAICNYIGFDFKIVNFKLSRINDILHGSIYLIREDESMMPIADWDDVKVFITNTLKRMSLKWKISIR